MLVRSRLKPYLILGLTVALIAAGSYFWGLRSSLLSLEKESRINIQKAKNFDSLKLKLNKKKEECSEYLVKEEVNINQFSFCQKFVDFFSGLQELK